MIDRCECYISQQPVIDLSPGENNFVLEPGGLPGIKTALCNHLDDVAPILHHLSSLSLFTLLSFR